MSYVVNTEDERQCNKCKCRIGIAKGFYCVWGQEICINCHELFGEFVKEKLNEFIQPERSKREDHYIGGYFPPPWNPNEHPEKTEGWLAFQEEQRKDPKYYGSGALNSVET